MSVFHQWVNVTDHQPVAFHKWLNYSKEQPIAAIAMYETRAQFILSIQTSGIDTILFDVEATSNMILLMGRWFNLSGIRNQSCTRSFESQISLPHPVHRETLRVETQPDRRELSIQLAKQIHVPRDEDLVFSVQFASSMVCA